MTTATNRLTWRREPGWNGGTCGAQHELLHDGEPTGWLVIHCGHPTALWPYYLNRPDGVMVVAGNGRGWQYLRAAQAAAIAVYCGRSAVVATARGFLRVKQESAG